MDKAEILTTPIGFIERVLGVPLYGWQDEIVTWFEDPRKRTKGSAVTPNGAGKSSGIVAGLALYYAACHAHGRCIITSKDSRQLDEQIWPSIERHKGKFPSWTWNDRYVETPMGGKIIGFTTNDPGRAEGWHKYNDVDGPLLIICDEAKSIDEPIFTAFDRCTFNGLLLISSPGGKAGRFFESHTKRAAEFRRRAVTLQECPHIPKEKVDDIIASYGLNHPFTRSAVFGEFMDDESIEEYVFNVNGLDRCLRNPPKWNPGTERIAFCDFGKGSAENVLCVRNGNKVEALESWREADEMASVGQFILRFRRHELRPEHIFGDVGGDIGKKMCDLLRDAGWDIHRINFGQPARDEAVYVSWSSEAWHECAKRVDKCEIILPDDDVLRAQLTSRKHVITSQGKLGLENKHTMAERGLKSPDRADGVVGVFNVWSMAPMQPKHLVTSWREELARHEEHSQLAGMDAGD